MFVTYHLIDTSFYSNTELCTLRMRLRDNAKSRDNTVLKAVCFNFNQSYKSIIWGLPRVYNELRNMCGANLDDINPWCCLSHGFCPWKPDVIQVCALDLLADLWFSIKKRLGRSLCDILLQNWMVKILGLALVCIPTCIPTNHMLQTEDYHVWCVVKGFNLFFFKYMLCFALLHLLYTHCSANSQCIFSMHY